MRLPPLVLLMAAVTLVGSNSLALSPIALEVGRGFGGASAQEVLVAASLFGAGTALAAVGIAPYADRIGLSRALVLALCVLTLGMAGTALAPALWVVWVAQGVAGLGSGVALPATYGLAAEIAPKGRESTFMGRVLMGWTLSLVFGASAAALIAEVAGWRAVHGVLAGLGVVVLLALALSPRMGEVRAAQGGTPWAALRVPGIGAALFVAGSGVDRAVAAGQRRLAHGLREGRVRVAGAGQVLGRGAELHRHADLVDQVARHRADDMAPRMRSVALSARILTKPSPWKTALARPLPMKLNLPTL
jgi:predicted MFS family arabinose efflux permease